MLSDKGRAGGQGCRHGRRQGEGRTAHRGAPSGAPWVGVPCETGSARTTGSPDADPASGLPAGIAVRTALSLSGVVQPVPCEAAGGRPRHQGEQAQAREECEEGVGGG